MKILDGRQIADFVKERQARQVRGLRQAWHVAPKLAVVQTVDDPVIDTYVRLKRAYAEDILIDFELFKIPQTDALETIHKLNQDDSVHGIIVQLPLADPAQTDDLLAAVSPGKDVDGLGVEPHFDPATPLAISWLLASYNIQLEGKKLAIVGNGRLVGKPLARLWRSSSYDVTVFDSSSKDLPSQLPDFSVIVTATGVPGLIKSAMVSPKSVVVDAGTAAEHGVIVGDIAEDLRNRRDIVVTPQKGGVGPLTVAALFDNVITAAQRVASASQRSAKETEPKN